MEVKGGGRIGRDRPSEIGHQAGDGRKAVRRGGRRRQPEASPPQPLAELNGLGPALRKGLTDAVEEIGTESRMRGRGIDRRRPDMAAIAVARQRRTDIESVGVRAEQIGHRILQRQKGIRGHDVAAKRMVDDQEVVSASDIGDRLVLEIAERAHDPVDRHLRTLAPKRFGQRRQRTGRAAVSPGQPLQAQIAHTQSFSLHCGRPFEERPICLRSR